MTPIYSKAAVTVLLITSIFAMPSGADAEATSTESAEIPVIIDTGSILPNEPEGLADTRESGPSAASSTETAYTPELSLEEASSTGTMIVPEAVLRTTAISTTSLLTALSLRITPDGDVPGVTVPCSGTDATMYLGHISDWPYVPGVMQRSECVQGRAMFQPFNIGISLDRMGGTNWKQYFHPPFYYVIKNTTGLAPGFAWKDYQGLLNLNGSFNGFRAASFYTADTEWPTLAAGPAFDRAEDGTWHNYADGDGSLGDETLPPEEATSTATTTGPSSVLFIPGIETPRLYRSSDNCDPHVSSCSEMKLWEPGLLGSTLTDLALDETGKSVRNDIYVKDGDVIASVGPKKIFESFFRDLNVLRDENVIREWKAVSYDWRLSLDDLMTRGREEDGRIYYEDATSTPYIEQTLRSLAATSKSGKVTIIGYSNGGLVAKALMRKLESEGREDLVDKVILVGTPQSGVPEAIGGLLYGYGQALPGGNCLQFPFKGPLCGFIVNRGQARAFTLGMPTAYQLLPSAAYFADVVDPEHPLVRFSGERSYGADIGLYGDTIRDESDFHDFLTGGDGRGHPATPAIDEPELLSSGLLGAAKAAHASLDSWTPPDGVEVYQIAGWGEDTVSGVELYDGLRASGLLGYKKQYRPLFVEDGDGVVPIPSALMIPENPRVRRFWIDLGEMRKVVSGARFAHGDLLEIPELREFLKGTLSGETSSLPNFIETVQPDASTSGKRLLFILHSPLTLELINERGDRTGLNEDGTIVEDISDSTYGEFGEAKYVIVPEDGIYTLSMHGKDSGTFSLDIEQQTGNDITASTTIANVPTTEHAIVTLTVNRSISDMSPLRVDKDGDGTTDMSLVPSLGETIAYVPASEIPLIPVVQEIVSQASKEANGHSSHRNTPRSESAQTSTSIGVPEASRTDKDHISVRTEIVSGPVPTEHTLDLPNKSDVLQIEDEALPEEMMESINPLAASVYFAEINQDLHSLWEFLYTVWESFLEFLSRINTDIFTPSV